MAALRLRKACHTQITICLAERLQRVQYRLLWHVAFTYKSSIHRSFDEVRRGENGVSCTIVVVEAQCIDQTLKLFRCAHSRHATRLAYW